jgi:Mrp family chromosome partitioning ATPase
MPSSDPADASLTSALYSPRMYKLLQHLRHHYDFVIIDAAAATASSNGFALARHVDGVILVVEAEYTRWPVVQNFKDRLIASGGNILGVVLNKRRYYIPSFLYKHL